MANQYGNPYGGSKSSAKKKDIIKKQRQTNLGYYRLGIVETYNKMTSRDIDIRQEYAKDLIGRYIGAPKDLITFRKKSTTQTALSLDEVFYVKIGKETVGKVSIRVQRLFSSSNLTFIYQEKNLRDGSTYSRDKQGSYKRKSASTRRRNNRKAKQKGNSRKF